MAVEFFRNRIPNINTSICYKTFTIGCSKTLFEKFSWRSMPCFQVVNIFGFFKQFTKSSLRTFYIYIIPTVFSLRFFLLFMIFSLVFLFTNLAMIIGSPLDFFTLWQATISFFGTSTPTFFFASGKKLSCAFVDYKGHLTQYGENLVKQMSVFVLY